MTFLVLLGAPGAGKGTQAPILASRLGLPHVATGELFRAAVNEGSAIGLEARRYMERGQLVPDAITVEMLLDRLARPDALDGAILDGFPRNLAQAGILTEALSARGSRVDRALEIQVPQEELVRRLSGRWICKANGHVYNETSHPPRVAGRCDLDDSPLIQRDDDRRETVSARLSIQLSDLHQVVEYYREHGLLSTVDGRRPVVEVTEALFVGRRGEASLMAVTLKSAAEIESMRRAGRVVAEVLALVESELKPGVTTAHLDALAEAHVRRSGALPSFKGYPGANPRRPFPGSICVSIDSEIVHGIPGERTIREGQLVSIDAGAIVDGWHGDAARSFFVGQPPEPIRELIETTRLAMMAGIAAAQPGNRIEDIGAAVEDVALPHGYGVVRQFVGHGIGRAMHEDPQVPNYPHRNEPAAGSKPACAWRSSRCSPSASYEAVMLPDDWTIVTRDGSLAAHFEHTIAITQRGPEILTTV